MWPPLLWHHADTVYNAKACYGGLTGLEILFLYYLGSMSPLELLYERGKMMAHP